MKNLYRPIESVIEDIKPETPNITTYRFRPKEPLTFEAGQFVELTVPGVGEAPFTPSSRSTDRECIDLSVMRVGRVTERIHALEEGRTVGLDGVVDQQDNYKKSGFVLAGRNVRHSGVPRLAPQKTAATIRAVTRDDLPALLAYDRAFFAAFVGRADCAPSQTIRPSFTAMAP